ncbi:IS110 family transposase [Candidatus Entotheonella serta]|nr:IS110 family transposase [Candidatus Entotheonella serta]
MITGQSKTTYDLFVGVDVAATTAAVTTQRPGTKPSRSFTIKQTPEGYRKLVEKLQAKGCAPTRILIVMEATGACWITLATRLVDEGFNVSVVNPAQAHHFAKALLKRAKTDAIDAQTLAQLAMILQPEPWTPPPPIYYELQQRLAQRDNLLDLRQQVRHQLHALDQHPQVVAEVRTRLNTLLCTFESQINDVEVEIATALNQDSQWAKAAERLQSIKGIGWVTAAWTLVLTLNFTTCESVESLTAYAGFALMPRQSGSSIWHRPSIGHSGNGRLRTAFYMATLTAARFNPVIKGFYERLRETGKPEKVARCAAARKLCCCS